MTAGDFFSVPPGHDSWVVGSEEYTSLHFLGADRYTRRASHRDLAWNLDAHFRRTVVLGTLRL
jgi:hypothetical protein